MKVLFGVVIGEAVVALGVVLYAMSDVISGYWIGAVGFVIVGIVGHVLTYMKVQNNDRKTDHVAKKIEAVGVQVDGKLTGLLEKITLLEATIANMKQSAAVKHAGEVGAAAGVEAGLAEARSLDAPPEPLH
jgi:hypothetical protein